MSIPNLLHEMCADLADADLNAIRKARGFSLSETASRTSFASFFVSSIGVAEAMQNLSAEEAITLHLLHQTGVVNIAFFERLYGSAAQSDRRYHATYTQRYKATFDAVKKNLVRRGLLIMAEVKQRSDAVQMERWRFALPPEFVPYLPSLLPAVTSDEPAGETSDTTVRKKLLQLIGGGPAFPNDRVKLEVKDGTIQLDGQPFSAARLQEGFWLPVCIPRAPMGIAMILLSHCSAADCSWLWTLTTRNISPNNRAAAHSIPASAFWRMSASPNISRWISNPSRPLAKCFSAAHPR